MLSEGFRWGLSDNSAEYLGGLSSSGGAERSGEEKSGGQPMRHRVERSGAEKSGGQRTPSFVRCCSLVVVGYVIGRWLARSCCSTWRAMLSSCENE